MKSLLLLCLLSWALLVERAAASPLTLGTRTESIPERGDVTYIVAGTARNEFSFMAPQDWKVATDAKAGIITWTSPDYQSSLQLKIGDENGDSKPALPVEELKQRAIVELSGGNITGQLPCYAAGGAGVAFDSEQVIEGKFRVISRVAFVPVVGGFVQLKLTAPKDQFARRQLDYSQFLNSLRIAKPVAK